MLLPFGDLGFVLASYFPQERQAQTWGIYEGVGTQEPEVYPAKKGFALPGSEGSGVSEDMHSE